MENSMATVRELNKAIETLKDECRKHRSCATCPLSDEYLFCNLRLLPSVWKTIKEGDSDDSTKAD